MPAKFQKRHYVALAAALHSTRDSSWDMTVGAIIDMLHDDNGNFQPDRFRLACEGGIHAKGVGAGIQGGPAMPYFKNERF